MATKKARVKETQETRTARIKKHGKKTRFKPGQSGNPAGKKKGSKNLSTILKELIDKDLTSIDPFTKKKATHQLGHWLCIQLLAMGMNKNQRALKMIFDRMEGKVPENINLNSSDSSSLEEIKKNIRNYISGDDEEE